MNTKCIYSPVNTAAPPYNVFATSDSVTVSLSDTDASDMILITVWLYDGIRGVLPTNLLTYLLTPWSMVLLEKLTGLQ
jgi:hypothetical protein